MNKSELVAAVAAHTDVDPKIVATVLNGTEDVVSATVKKGEKVTFTGFLSFERVDRKARKGRNPSTGESIRVKASKAPRVTAGRSFKKVVNGEAPAPRLGTRPAKVTPGRKTAASRAATGPSRQTTRATTRAATKGPGRPAKAPADARTRASRPRKAAS